MPFPCSLRGKCPTSSNRCRAANEGRNYFLEAQRIHASTHLNIRRSFVFVVSVQSFRQLPGVCAQLDEIEKVEANRDLKTVVLRSVPVVDEAAVEDFFRVDLQLWPVHGQVGEHFVEEVHGNVAHR